MNNEPSSKASQSFSQKKTSEKFRHLFQLLLRSKTGFIGFIIVLIFIVIGLLANFLAPYDPAQTHPEYMLQPPFWMEGGNFDFILGTDQLGRDIFSRIVFGTRISILVGIIAVVIAGFIGGFLGLISGYYGGVIDAIIMRFVDAFIAIPSL